MTSKLREELKKIKAMDDREEKHIKLDALMMYVLEKIGFEEFVVECGKILDGCWYS